LLVVVGMGAFLSQIGLRFRSFFDARTMPESQTGILERLSAFGSFLAD
jgi:hypothetical protein